MGGMVWMMVTMDKYELPIAVADSAAELARIVGTSKNSIDSAVSRYYSGKIKTSSYRRIRISEDENE